MRELRAAITVDAGMNAHAVMEQLGYVPADPATRALVRSLFDIAATLVPVRPLDLLAAARLQSSLDIIGDPHEREAAGALSYVMNFIARKTPA